MAGGRPIRISVLGDSKDFETAMDRAARRAGDLETAMDSAAASARSFDDRIGGVGDGADTLASKGQQAAGALAGLGQVLGGPVGAGMVGLGSAFQIAADSGDLLNAAIEGGGKVWNKAVGFVQSLTKAETYATLAKQAGAGAQWLLNAAMSANPIVLVVLAIAALVAGLVWFFTQTEVGRQAWATFTAFLTSLWSRFSTFMGGVWSAITGFFTGAAARVTEAWSAAGAWFASLPARIKAMFDGAGAWLSSAGSNILTGLKAGAAAAWSNVLGWLGGLKDEILAPFSAAKSWLEDAGRNLLVGLWNGISDKVAWIRSKIAEFVGSVERWFKDFFGIHSPSRLMAALGRMLPAGLAQGILSAAHFVTAAWDSVASGLTLPPVQLAGINGAHISPGGVYIAPGAIVVNAGVGDPVEIGAQVSKCLNAYLGIGGRA